MTTADTSSIASAVSSAIVALFKQHYGRGPERARTFLNGEYVFTVLEGGLTRNEETLIAAGQEGVVRRYRLAFQEAMTETMTETVADIVGRRVIGYHSQIVFNPARGFEIFVLDEPVA